MAYIGREPQIGNFQVCDAISTVNNQAAYTMQVGGVNVSPETANHMLVSLNGILQAPTTSFTVSGSTITFAANLVTGDVIDFIQILGSVLDLGVPSDATVSTAKIVDGAVTSAKLSAGKVLQVSNMAVITSAQNISSSTYVDLTGFSINITPSSTSNKIFMCANISSLIGATGRGYGLKFLRDSTVVYDSNALYVHYPQSAGFRSMTTWNFIDSPSSTSEITYKIQVGTQSAAEVSFQEGSIKSTFYLMEIAG